MHAGSGNGLLDENDISTGTVSHSPILKLNRVDQSFETLITYYKSYDQLGILATQKLSVYR